MPRAFLAALAVLMASAALARASSQPARMEGRETAVLMALDKVTARATRLSIPAGTQAGYKNLRITVRACRKASPLEPPESAAFLEITELKDKDSAQLLFSGWMFASSPALSAMDHPVYDIWVVDCEGRALTTDIPALPGPAP